MFLKKIEKISEELGRNLQDLQDVAKESLLYGMKLNRTPGNLKRALKKVNYDPKKATPMWRGNAYLLLTFPKILTNPKTKIVNLPDFLFAKQVLKAEHYTELEKRIKNIPENLSTHQILADVLPEIHRQTRRGRFLPQFDSMHGNIKDIEQDINEIAIAIVNLQFTNFKSHVSEDINKYISYCLNQKSKTYIRSKAPKVTSLKIENPDEFEKIVNKNKSENNENDGDLRSVEFREDMEGILTPNQYEAVMLFLDMADDELKKKFEVFLAGYGKKKESLTQPLLKKYIEKYLGVNAFTLLQRNKKLIGYLTNYTRTA